MKSLIFSDFKRRLKNPITFILIWMILMTSYAVIDEIKTERLSRSFSGNYDTEEAKLNIRYEDNIHWKTDANISTRQLIMNISQKIIEADRKKDYRLYNKYSAFDNLIGAKLHMAHDEIRFKAAENKIRRTWDDLSDGIEYEETNISYKGDQRYLLEFRVINESKFYKYLYDNDLEVFYKDEVNNISFLYNYIIDILPMLLIIFTIILMYNSINRDVSEESAKLILTQGIQRWKYYLSKYISGVLHIISTISISLISISIFLGIKYEFISLKYPVFYFARGIKSLTPRPNYVKDLIYPNSFISISRIPMQIVGDYETILLGDKIIPFYRFLALSILLGILFVLFAAALIQLISAIIDNKIISFTTTTLVFLVGYKLSEPFIYERHYNLSPFTMNNGAAIVNGSFNVTTLTSFLILSCSTIILLLGGIIYFKRKEI